MLGRWTPRAAVVLLFGLALPGLARADGPGPGPAAPITEPPYRLRATVIVPTDPNYPDQQRRRLGCWATHFANGCGSFRSDMVFIFGSCRAFYGEACRKGPPGIYPPGYGPAGYGPAGGNDESAGGRCSCP